MNKTKICLPGMLPRIIAGTIAMLLANAAMMAIILYFMNPANVFGEEILCSHLVLWQKICVGIGVIFVALILQHLGLMAIKKYMSPRQ